MSLVTYIPRTHSRRRETAMMLKRVESAASIALGSMPASAVGVRPLFDLASPSGGPFPSDRPMRRELGVARCAWRRLGGAVLGVLIAMSAPAAWAQPPVSDEFRITTLSSSPDTVTAGDALIRIDVPRVVPMGKVSVTLNGTDITGTLRRDDDARTLTGFVDGLSIGINRLFARSNVPGLGRPSVLQLVNHPKDGPIFSGPYQTPFVCEADKFMVPVFGAVLGQATPPECSVARRIDYFYRTRSGAYVPWPLPVVPRDVPAPAAERIYPADLATTTITIGTETPYEVPFIVRMETGSANRGIYHIWVLHDPYEPRPNFYTPSRGWNQRFLYWFGQSCTPGWYHQGVGAGLTMSATNPGPARLVDVPLSRGYAMGMSSLTVGGNNCNDVIAAESMMTVKERMIETLGPPRFTIGAGFSGGAMHQHMIAENYPGLLDGIVPGASYPDIFSGLRFLWDAGLLHNYFGQTPLGAWTDAQKRAVTGFGDYATVTNPAVAEFLRALDPRGFCPPELDVPSLYDPVTNPHGIRCDIFSAYRNVFGTDDTTGFVRRFLDNVGVQYGLAALNTGTITAAQFVDLNARVGGWDIDGHFGLARTEGDGGAINRAYHTGRVTHGAGLASTPIIDYRSYSDKGVPATGRPPGDQHVAFNTLSLRERLIRTNGHADNHVMVVERLLGPAGNVALYAPVQSGLLVWAFETMDRWLTLIADDESDRPKSAKILEARSRLEAEAGLADGCNPDGTATAVPKPPHTSGLAACLQLFPVYSFPRGVAGESIANDVIKCQLKAIDWADYSNVTEPADVALLQTELPKIFPAGVCDFSKRGVGHNPPLDTWLDYGGE